MKDAKVIQTPVNPSSKLKKATECVDQKLYQSAVGSLIYLSRPDITFAISNVAKFCMKPTKEHWTAVKRIFRYLKGSLNFGLVYRNDKSKECIGYSDSDWGGDYDDHKSTSGYLFQSGEQPSAGKVKSRHV